MRSRAWSAAGESLRKGQALRSHGSIGTFLESTSPRLGPLARTAMNESFVFNGLVPGIGEVKAHGEVSRVILQAMTCLKGVVHSALRVSRCAGVSNSLIRGRSFRGLQSSPSRSATIPPSSRSPFLDPIVRRALLLPLAGSMISLFREFRPFIHALCEPWSDHFGRQSPLRRERAAHFSR